MQLPVDDGGLEEGGDLDALVVYGMLRTHAALSPYLDRGLSDLNLTGAQLNALLVLRGAGPEGMPLGEIGRRLVVTKANVTGLVDRLERQGLVRRESGGDTGDRRVTRAALTDKGLALLEAALPRRREMLAAALDGLSADEKGQIVSLLSRLRKSLRDAGAGSGEG